jgi:hypothetical protein
MGRNQNEQQGRKSFDEVGQMAKRDKHAKNLKRRDKVARDANQRCVVKAIREFPEIVMVPNEAPADFVEAVRQAAKLIDFRCRDDFPEWEANHYRKIKSDGKQARFQVRLTKEQESDPSFDRKGYAEHCTLHFAYNLGEQIFRRIPPDILLRHIPYNDVFFVPEGTQIRGVFRSLKRAKGPGGTVYYSRHRPKMVIEGREYTVAFSAHALQRMCERLTYVWPSYAQLGELFAFVDQCEEFEPADIDGPAFTMFNQCIRGSWQEDIVRGVFEDAFDPEADYRIRLGYFPVVLEGEFAKAKTLLYPGFKGTPEHRAIHAASIEWPLKRQLLEIAEQLEIRSMLNPHIADILRWFQENGVEQVQKRKAKYLMSREKVLPESRHD